MSPWQAKGMKIFITGGSGFIGSKLIQKLSSKYEFLAMARSESSEKKVRELGATPVRCDLDTVTAKYLKYCDLVIHSAAFVEPWGKREDYWKTNVLGTEKMLEVSQKAKIKRFIFIGTEAALFDGSDLNGINESQPYPKTQRFLYSETKAEAEKRVIAANETDRFETVSIRPRLVWGPGDSTILPNLIEVVDRGVFKWINKGRALTSSTHIDNVLHGIELALQKGQGGECYFITDEEEHSFHHFLSAYLDTAGRKPGKGNVPAWLARSIAWWAENTYRLLGIKKKPPITRFSAAIMTANCTIHSDKARRHLGYQPQISVAEGFAELKRIHASQNAEN